LDRARKLCCCSELYRIVRRMPSAVHIPHWRGDYSYMLG
jgi:hypothetical protein